MDWMKICNAIQHEVYPKVSSVVKSIINKNNINKMDLSPNTVNTVIEKLKSKNIATEPREYIKKLIERAKRFKPMNKC